MNMSKKQIQRNKIRIYIVAKKQPIMLSYLPHKEEDKPQAGSQERNEVVQQLIKEKRKLSKNKSMSLLINEASLKKCLDIEDEITELLYLGRVVMKFGGKQKECRSFLIRRIGTLEIMYTNGLSI